MIVLLNYWENVNDVKSCHWEVKMKLFLLVIVVISFFLVLGGAYSLYKHQYEEGTGGYMLNGMRHGDVERIPENRSQFGLESATRQAPPAAARHGTARSSRI